MGFTIPNNPDANYPDQAEPDSVDFSILAAGFAGTGVVSGCEITENESGLTLSIAEGMAIINNNQIEVAADTPNLTSHVDTSYNRFVLIVVDDQGDISVDPGPLSNNPRFPAYTVDTVVLCSVYLPANVTTIPDEQIVDKRLFFDIAGGGGGVSDASGLTYAPAVGGDWDAGDPGNTDDALDELAARLTVAEGIIPSDAGDLTYTPAVATDWDGDADPGDLDDAVNQLAERVDDLEGAGGGGGLVPIADVILGSDTASISFTSIPGTYAHLKIVGVLRSDRASNDNDGFTMIFNGDTTGTNYRYVSYRLTQSGTISVDLDDSEGNIATTFSIPAATSPANYFGNIDLMVMDYATTGRFRHMQGYTQDPASTTVHRLGLQTGLWRNTADAITQIDIAPLAGSNFIAGSRLTLYGIAEA